MMTKKMEGVYVMLCACSFIGIAILFPSPSCLSNVHKKIVHILHSTTIGVNISTPNCVMLVGNGWHQGKSSPSTPVVHCGKK
jgi:hypothetical protein